MRTPEGIVKGNNLNPKEHKKKFEKKRTLGKNMGKMSNIFEILEELE